jgi:C_GCAxxG_C_C family probable redox protein
VKSGLIPRVSTYFGGGMGGTHRHICGAVTAGVMATGMALGRDKLSDDRSKGNDLTRRLLKEFEEAFGSLTCYQLVGLDPSDKDWAAKFAALKIREEKCTRYVRFVVEHWLDWAGDIRQI